MRQYRKTMGLSQMKFAEKADITFQTLSSIERGITFPSYPILMKIIETLNVPIVKLFCYDEEKGFENVFTENLGDSYYGYSYRGLQEVRGCFIGDDFYLVGGGQIRIYDMANDYKEVGRLEL